MRRAVVLTAALLLAACGGGEPKEGELSADEDRQLNEAAEMLDEPAEEENRDADDDTAVD